MDDQEPFPVPLATARQNFMEILEGMERARRHIQGQSRQSRQSKQSMGILSPRFSLLANMPYAIPFAVRLEIFRAFVTNDQERLPIGPQAFFARRKVTVRRGQIFADGFAQMAKMGPLLKEGVQVNFKDQYGELEAGIDGGGLFKEFLTSLSKEAFSTDRGLWLATRDQSLYPNPHSYAKEQAQLEAYHFIGMIIGKALYEGILVDVHFASFFLNKLLGKKSFLDDLPSLDPDLYQGLLNLKNYTGDVEADLGLNFTINDDDLGLTRTHDLIPRGSEVSVTQSNRITYAYLTANYRLNRQIEMQSEAFLRGFHDIISPAWLNMFNAKELQLLIGGDDAPIDVDDLKRNTEYGGFSGDDEITISLFWQVVREMNPNERQALVKFVTSCGRPPLLGFAGLTPRFGIRDAGMDQSRLPTSSTCVNQLKLPRYTDKSTLRSKLLYAINSGAGFDLS